MPRHKPLVPAAPPLPPVVPLGCIIDPHAVFRLGALTSLLGLKRSSLAREIREKRLRVVKRCGTYFFLGSDILEWLRGGTLKPNSEG
jgi:hypothetical protein